MTFTTDILIRSYCRDFRWLSFCLQSINKYCHGFRDVVLVVPEGSQERLNRSGIKVSNIKYCPKFRDDYLGQQITKLYADTLTDADYIVHVDSDCIFWRNCTPFDLCEGERPIILMTPCRMFSDNAPWQTVTQRFLSMEVYYDFMRRQPLMYPRWLYGELREYARILHDQEAVDYIQDQPPLAFSEFNALGAFAYLFHRNSFSWIETKNLAFDEKFCRIFWSWEGLQKNHEHEIKSILSSANPNIR
jgi:hypothetical protein